MIDSAPRTPDERPKEVGAPEPTVVYGIVSSGRLAGLYSTEEKAKRVHDFFFREATETEIKPFSLDIGPLHPANYRNLTRVNLNPDEIALLQEQFDARWAKAPSFNPNSASPR